MSNLLCWREGKRPSLKTHHRRPYQEGDSIRSQDGRALTAFVSNRGVR